MKITLYNNGRAYYDGETFTVCDEPLNIEIETELDNLYAVCTIDKERTTIKVKDGILSIPPSFLAPGVLFVSFNQVENGEIIRQWRSERVTLRGLNGEYEAIPELVTLQKEMTTIKQALKELYGLINKNNQI